jgi:hypothetical protein
MNEVSSLISSANSIDATETLSNILMSQPEIVAATLADAEQKLELIEKKLHEGNAIISVDLWETLRTKYRDQADKWKNHVTQK